MDFEKCTKEEMEESFCEKMFNRYQNEFKVIDERGFGLMAQALGIRGEDVKETWMHICNRSNVVTYDKLREFLR